MELSHYVVNTEEGAAAEVTEEISARERSEAVPVHHGAPLAVLGVSVEENLALEELFAVCTLLTVPSDGILNLHFGMSW